MKRKDVYDFLLAHRGQYFSGPQIIDAFGGGSPDSARRMCRELAALGFVESGKRTVRRGRGADTYRLRADAPEWPTKQPAVKVVRVKTKTRAKTAKVKVVPKTPRKGGRPRIAPVWEPTTKEGRATAIDVLSYFSDTPRRVGDVSQLCEVSLSSVVRCTGWLEQEGCLLPHPDGGYTRTYKHPPAVRVKEAPIKPWSRGKKTAHLAGLLAGF